MQEEELILVDLKISNPLVQTPNTTTDVQWGAHEIKQSQFYLVNMLPMLIKRAWHILKALSCPCPLSSKEILFIGFQTGAVCPRSSKDCKVVHCQTLKMSTYPVQLKGRLSELL